MSSHLTIARLETIASTTSSSDVRVLAETMIKYVKEQDKAKEPSKQLGFKTKAQGGDA